MSVLRKAGVGVVVQRLVCFKNRYENDDILQQVKDERPPVKAASPTDIIR
jgi:hypothetical protein